MSVRKRVVSKSPVRENRTQGSVGGAPSNGRSSPPNAPISSDFKAVDSSRVFLEGTRFQLNITDHLSASTVAQFIYLYVEVSDGENTVSRQVRLSVLPSGVKAEKLPVRLRAEMVANPLAAEKEYVTHLTGFRYNDQTNYRVLLVYNNGDEEYVTKNVSVSGNGDTSVSVNSTLAELTMKGEASQKLIFTYTSNGETFTSALTFDIQPLVLTSIWVTAKYWAIIIGEALQATVEAFFENNTSEDVTQSSNTHFRSLQENIATISDSGLIIGRNVGSANLEFSHFDAQSGINKTVQQVLEVMPVKLSALKVFPTKLELTVGDNVSPDIKLELLYNNGSTRALSRKQAVQFSGNSRVALINDLYDLVPVSGGNTQLHYKFTENGIEVEAIVDVHVGLPAPKVVRLEVYPEDLEFQPKNKQVFEVLAVYNTGEKERINFGELLTQSDTVSSGDNLLTQGNTTSSTNLSKAFFKGVGSTSNLSVKVSISGNSVQMDSQLLCAALVTGTSNLTFQLGEHQMVATVTVVPEPDKASIEEMAQLGGAVYNSELIERNLGSGNADILVYNKGRTLASVDVSDPMNRNDLDTISLPEWISDFQLSDRFIHVVQWYGDYSMITFDNPAKLEKPEGYGTTIEGYAKAVRIFDLKKSIRGVEHIARYAFILSNQRWSWPGRVGINGVVVLDITNPLNVVRVGKLKLDGYMNAMEIKDHILYVTSEASWNYDWLTRRWTRSGFTGVQAIDIANPVKPQIRKSIDLGGYTRGIEVGNNKLYVGSTPTTYWWSYSSQTELKEFDITEPADPKVISTTKVPSYWISGMNASGNGLYMAMGSQGMGYASSTNTGFQFETTWHPKPAAWVTSSGNETDMSGDYWTYVYDVKVHKGYAYIANGHNGMAIYKMNGDNLGDAIEGYPNVSYVTDVLRAGDYSLVSAGFGGILSFDSKDLSKPQLVDNYTNKDYSIYRMTFDPVSKTLFASAYSRRYYWWWGYFGAKDVIDPYIVIALRLDEKGVLRELSRQAVSGSVQDLSYSGNQLVVSSNDYSYRSATSYIRGFVSTYAWENDTLSSQSNWEVPSNKSTSTNYYYSNYSSQAYGLASIGNHVYVATPAGIYILKSEGTVIEELKLVPANELTNNSYSYYRWFYASRIIPFAEGHFLALPTWSGLQTLAVKQPDQLQWVSQLNNSWYSDIAFENTTALVTGWKEMRMVDYRDPSQPTEILSKNIGGWFQALDWKDDLALVASGWEGISFYKIITTSGANNALPLILGQNLGKVFQGNVISANVFIFDGDHDELTLSISGNASGGNLSLAGNTVSYEAFANYRGADSFALAVSDGKASRSAKFSVDVVSSTTLLPTLILQAPLTVGTNTTIYSYPITYFSSYTPKTQQTSSGNWESQFGYDFVGIAKDKWLGEGYYFYHSNYYYHAERIASGNYKISYYYDYNGGGLGTEDHYGISGNLKFSWQQIGGNNLVLPKDVQIGPNEYYNYYYPTAPATTGNVILQLTLTTDSGQTLSDNATIYVNATPRAFLDQNNMVVNVGDNVTLMGNATDLENDQLYYYWYRLGTTNGNTISLNNPNSQRPQFTVLSGTGKVEYNLHVSDGYSSSNTVTQTIWINNRPVANAGPDQTVSTNALVQLSAGLSTDLDADTLDYTWTQISGNTVVLGGSTSVPTFTAPAVSGNLVFRVTVSDGRLTATDEVTVIVVAPATTLSKPILQRTISGSPTFSATIGANGSLSMTGLNKYGELGLGDNVTRNQWTLALTGNVVAVSAGHNHSLVVKDDGSLWSAGDNVSGQLGRSISGNLNQFQQALSANAQQASAGYAHSLVVKNDGSLWSFGYNLNGQLGDGSFTDRHVPVQLFSGNVVQASAGDYHSLVVKDDGSLWSFGYNNNGQLGDNSTVDKASPTKMLSANVTYAVGGALHSLILKADGSLWGVGANSYGQLGDNTITERLLPVEIVSGNVKDVAAGEYHSLFVKTDGSLWGMGRNNVGQLGSNTMVNSIVPIEIMSSGVAEVEAGASHSLIRKTDGSIFLTGLNSNGQLGDGTTSSSNVFRVAN
jgi:alpha-tubulin suppressor-like RCC1 family protein